MNQLVAFREFDQKILLVEGRDLESLDEETENSLTSALGDLNKILECTGYQIEPSAKLCEQRHKKLQAVDLSELGSTDEEVGTNFPSENSCIILGNTERKVSLAKIVASKIPSSHKDCLKTFKSEEVENYMNSLQTCMWDFHGYIDQVKTLFEVPKKMVADTIQQLTEIKSDFNTVRLQFRETFQKI